MASTWIAKDTDPNAAVAEQNVSLLNDDGDRIRAVVDGVEVDLTLRPLADGRLEVRDDHGMRRLLRARDLGHAVLLVEGGEQHHYEVSDARARWLRQSGAGAGGGGDVRASMPGRVVRLPVPVGGQVAKGAVVAVLEAMKMENDVKAPIAGVVSEIAVAEGDAVEARALLLRITPEATDA